MTNERLIYKGLHEIAVAISDHACAVDRAAQVVETVARKLEEIGVNMVTAEMGDALRGLASLETK
jgi:hypothetical protein